ncbi:MAG TPA: EthD domain-containing protein [Acidimicrobiales bacterium]|nr:EthD domain-containing protein [Acidimicrobiales bacterium]
MYKIAAVARFADANDKLGSRQRWAGGHAALARAVPGLARYTQSEVIGPLPHEADPEGVYSEDAQTSFDGYSSFWFPDRDAFVRASATPAWRALMADADDLFDVPWQETMSAAVEERVIVEGEPGPYKVVWITRFKPELTKEEGHRYWEHVHGPIVRDAGIDRYVQNHVVGALVTGAGENVPDFDGFSECWFADEQGFIDALATPHWRRLHEDRHQIFDMARMWCGALTQRVVIG